MKTQKTRRRVKRNRPMKEGELLVSKTGVKFIPVMDHIQHRGFIAVFPPDPEMHPDRWMKGGTIHSEKEFDTSRHATMREAAELKRWCAERDIEMTFMGTVSLPGVATPNSMRSSNFIKALMEDQKESEETDADTENK